MSRRHALQDDNFNGFGSGSFEMDLYQHAGKEDKQTAYQWTKEARVAHSVRYAYKIIEKELSLYICIYIYIYIYTMQTNIIASECKPKFSAKYYMEGNGRLTNFIQIRLGPDPSFGNRSDLSP